MSASTLYVVSKKVFYTINKSETNLNIEKEPLKTPKVKAIPYTTLTDGNTLLLECATVCSTILDASGPADTGAPRARSSVEDAAGEVESGPVAALQLAPRGSTCAKRQ